MNYGVKYIRHSPEDDKKCMWVGTDWNKVGSIWERWDNDNTNTTDINKAYQVREKHWGYYGIDGTKGDLRDIVVCERND